jgi:Leu/Phe-tRNA-protein transferase
MTPRGEPRGKKFTMVMTDDERSQLEAVAAHEQRTASDWIRVQIRSAYEALPKKKTAKK